MRRVKVLLYSGGLDSYIANFFVKPDIRLYVNLGTLSSGEEMARLDSEVRIVQGPDMGLLERTDVILPSRNVVLASIGSVYGNHVYLAASSDDRGPDKDRDFALKMSDVLNYSERRRGGCEVTVWGEDRMKVETVKAYLDAGGNGRDLAYGSYSCYIGEIQECGICNSCVRKFLALRYNGIKTEGIFTQEPSVDDLVRYYGDALPWDVEK